MNLFKNIFGGNTKSQPKLNSLYDIALDNNMMSGVNEYTRNVIVYKCVNLIALTASHVPWKIYTIKNSIKHPTPEHPIIALLTKPNNNQAGADFFVNFISNQLLYGDAYILATGIENQSPKELFILNSQNVDIVTERGQIKYFRYMSEGNETLYPVNTINGQGRILHLKNYNPSDNLYGVSCLKSAEASIEAHNLASQWNISLLKNNARPSGALVMNNSNTYLTDEQFERLQEQLDSKYVGAGRVGRPLLLEGGLDWKEMSINPKDMDFIEVKNTAAREIALAFGVPPQLLGLTGDNTYSNMQEARLALWEETIIPLLDKISDAFTNWFAFFYEDDLRVDFDREEISALTGKRENLWSRIADSDFITINEKRNFIGLPPIKNGDTLSE